MGASGIRYAVIGLGHGHEHVDAIMKHPSAELVMCCDLNEDMFRALNLPSSVQFTTDMSEVARRSDIDAVVIALPTALHMDSSIMMLGAGKHVLCEKPLALTLEDGERIRDAAARSGKVFQLGYEVRYSPFHRKVMQICRNGDIGEVTNVWWNMFCYSDSSGWRAQRKQRGGKIFDCGCHYYNILENWAGAPAKRICVFGNMLGKTGPTADLIPETAIIMFEYANGVRGVFNLSEKCPNLQGSTCGVAGTNGKIEADPYYPDGAGSIFVHANGGEFQYNIDIKDTGKYDFSPGHLGFREQHTAFMDSILNGAEVQVTAEDGLQVTRILEAIDQSLATGQVVDL